MLLVYLRCFYTKNIALEDTQYCREEWGSSSAVTLILVTDGGIGYGPYSLQVCISTLRLIWKSIDCIWYSSLLKYQYTTKPDCAHWVNVLKELYTSETTLAQKIVLTPLNNEFRLRKLYSTSFMLKNPPEFLKKIHKNQFSASWRGLMGFIHKYKVVYF